MNLCVFKNVLFPKSKQLVVLREPKYMYSGSLP